MLDCKPDMPSVPLEVYLREMQERAWLAMERMFSGSAVIDPGISSTEPGDYGSDALRPGLPKKLRDW